MRRAWVLLTILVAGGSAQARTYVVGVADRGKPAIAILGEQMGVFPVSIHRADGSGEARQLFAAFTFGYAELEAALAPNEPYVLTLPDELPIPFVAGVADECSTFVDLGPETIPAVAARTTPPEWTGPSPLEEIQIGDGGYAIAALRMGKLDPGVLLRLTLRDGGGRELWTRLGPASGNVCPRLQGAWPDHVFAEMTLVDLAGRASSPRRAEIPVVEGDDFAPGFAGPGNSHRRPAISLAERILLFAVVPLLAGWLAGSICGRRRRR